jgi:hypothetical protein
MTKQTIINEQPGETATRIEILKIMHFGEGRDKYAAPVETIEYRIAVDGELLYDSKMIPELHLKDKSPVREFERWLLEYAYDRRNVARNACEPFKHLAFWQRFGKFFNFELKLLRLKFQLFHVKCKHLSLKVVVIFRRLKSSVAK